MSDDDAEAAPPPWGPAMEALTELQRGFVLAMVANPLAHQHELAKRAGYKGNNNVLRVVGHRLSRDDRIIAAVHEETAKHVKYGGLIGITGLVKLAGDPDHPDHFKACNSLADRGGFGAVAKQEIKVERTDYTGAALVERIKTLARQLGVDETKLLGANSVLGSNATIPEMKVIEGEVVK